MDNSLAENQKPAQRGWRSTVSLIVALLLAALFLYLAIRGISWKEVWLTLRSIRIEYFLLVLVIFSINAFIRSMRWGTLVRAQKPVSPLHMFWITMIGYLGNIYLPARAGELIRCGYMARNEKVNFGFAFATALTERIMDVVALVVIGVLSLSTMQNMPDWVPTALRSMGIVGLVAVVGLFVAPYFEGFIKKIISILPVPQTWRKMISDLAEKFLVGTRAFRDPVRAMGFAGFTVVIWFLDATNAIIMAKAFNLTLTFPQAFLMLVALGLASALPSTPGSLGINQFVAVTLLPLFQFTRSQAFSYILVLQASSYIMITFWGLLGLWFSRNTNRSSGS